MSYPVFEYTRGVCKLVQGIGTIERKRVMMVVKNTRLDKYLIVQYKSNDEISFPAGGIEAGDDKKTTVIKELQEEAGISGIESIQELTDWFFEVRFYSPVRKKNYRNHTAIYLIETQQDIGYDLLSEEEKSIQIPSRWSLEEIRNKITSSRENTNYEAMDYILSKLEDEKL